MLIAAVPPLSPYAGGPAPLVARLAGSARENLRKPDHAARTVRYATHSLGSSALWVGSIDVQAGGQSSSPCATAPRASAEPRSSAFAGEQAVDCGSHSLVRALWRSKYC